MTTKSSIGSRPAKGFLSNLRFTDKRPGGEMALDRDSAARDVEPRRDQDESPKGLRHCP